VTVHSVITRRILPSMYGIAAGPHGTMPASLELDSASPRL